jgi:hypothetical protein
VDYYERALQLLREQQEYSRAARTLIKLGLTHHTAFDFQRSRQAYREGFALWQKVGRAQEKALPPAPHAYRGLWSDPPTLDPTIAGDVTSSISIAQLFSGLVELNAEMAVVPDVTHSWEVLEDGRKFVFHLRDDVYWSDGAQVTASFSWSSRTWRQDFELVGTQAKVYWHPYDSGQVIKTVGRQIDDLQLTPAANVHQPLIEDFVGAVRDGRAPACPLTEAARTNQLVDAIYRSAASGTEVTP